MDHNTLYNVEDDGNITLIRFLTHNVGDLPAKEIYQIAESNSTNPVLIDFSGVVLIRSASLAILVTLQRKLNSHGRKLAFYGLDYSLRSLLTMTMLHRVFTLCDTKEEAIKSVS